MDKSLRYPGLRCPDCGSSYLRNRVTMTPPIRCDHCGWEGTKEQLRVPTVQEKQRPWLASDGLNEVAASEFQSFPARVEVDTKREQVRLVRLVIPMEINRRLGITKESFLEVAIRKVKLSYLVKTYGSVSKRVQKQNRSNSPVVSCPKCKREGHLAYYNRDGRKYYRIRHEGKARCYIAPKVYVEECIQFEQLLKAFKANTT